MQETKEISALFTLIDDPDEEVFSTVSGKIVEYGKNIIPNLEDLWENTQNETIQERIEQLIHRLHFTDLLNDVKTWKESDYHDLLLGALLISRFQYPELNTTPVLQEIEKIRRNIWLELNSFLTPMEQANVMSSIIYNYYNLKGIELAYHNPDDFCIHKVLESKKGNALSNGILYLILCELLDIPVRAINIPQQFILAFFHTDYEPETYIGDAQQKIHFYIDAVTGQCHSAKDIDGYFKRINITPTTSYFKPISNKRIIRMLAIELSKCYDAPQHQYKLEQLQKICNLLED